MKEFFKKSIALILALTAMFSFEIFTVDVSAVSSQKDIINVDELNTVSGGSARVTGLIDSYYIGVNRSGDYMYILAKVNCIYDVVKCGFKEIKIYRKVTGTTNWTYVRSYTDLYYDGCAHTFGTSLQILPNFDYRATCVHYAKKNILMTQTIDDYSNVI